MGQLLRFHVMPRVIITVPDKTPQPYRFALDRQVVTIGRGSVNDIAIDCASVSVKHAEMVRIEGGYELRDLASTNGTKLDGERMDVVPLRNGSVAELGDVAFDFQLSGEEREELAREKVLDDLPVRRKAAADEPAGEEVPRLRRAAPKKPVVVDTSGGGGGFMMFLLFVFLALVAFYAGLSIRYSKDTGGSLFEAIQTKSKTLKAASDAVKPAPKPAPVPPALVPAPVPAPDAVPAPAPAPEPAPEPAPGPVPQPAPAPESAPGVTP